MSMPVRVVVIALLVAHAANAQTPDKAVRDYLLCVRRAAEVLEPSGDTPQDVARAAVLICQREEMSVSKDSDREAQRLRETALFYGAAQATVARACRIVGRCGLAPLPNPD